MVVKTRQHGRTTNSTFAKNRKPTIRWAFGMGTQSSLVVYTSYKLTIVGSLPTAAIAHECAISDGNPAAVNRAPPECPGETINSGRPMGDVLLSLLYNTGAQCKLKLCFVTRRLDA